MPEMDGHELAHRAQRIRPKLRVLQLSGRERRARRLPDDQKAFHGRGFGKHDADHR
jgi:hypothetical protein